MQSDNLYQQAKDDIGGPHPILEILTFYRFFTLKENRVRILSVFFF